eukprot:1228758-Prymnesium_polylepis.2
MCAARPRAPPLPLSVHVRRVRPPSPPYPSVVLLRCHFRVKTTQAARGGDVWRVGVVGGPLRERRPLSLYVYPSVRRVSRTA